MTQVAFAGPPPNFSVPPPSFGQPPARYAQKQPAFTPRDTGDRPPRYIPPGVDLGAFDGKRMRKAVYRKTVDYNSSVVTYMENRVWQRDHRDKHVLQPDVLYTPNLMPPPDMLSTPMNCVTSRFIRTSTNKIKCPIFCVCWTPEGRRLVTGASSGEFTLWNGLTFNFETILQAHDTSVRAMIWSHNDQWMLTADHTGFVKYWQSNMNNVKMYQAHKDPIRGIRCVAGLGVAREPIALGDLLCRVMYAIFLPVWTLYLMYVALPVQLPILKASDSMFCQNSRLIALTDAFLLYFVVEH